MLQKSLSFASFPWLEVIVVLFVVLASSRLEGAIVDRVKLMFPLVLLKLSFSIVFCAMTFS